MGSPLCRDSISKGMGVCYVCVWGGGPVIYLLQDAPPPTYKHAGNVALSNIFIFPPPALNFPRRFASVPLSFFFIDFVSNECLVTVTPVCTWKAGDHMKMTPG